MPAPGETTAPVPCPHLPDIGGVSHPASRLAVFRDGDRGAAFYRQALHCGQSRWLEKLPAQALLMLNRAMGASLCHTCDAAVLADHPIPYRAIGWILRQDDGGGFLGNPRRHYQHLATRMSGGDIPRRTARAWACWTIAKHVNPAWEADHVQIEREGILEPAFEEVHAALLAHGLPGEDAEWRAALGEVSSPPPDWHRDALAITILDVEAGQVRELDWEAAKCQLLDRASHAR